MKSLLPALIVLLSLLSCPKYSLGQYLDVSLNANNTYCNLPQSIQIDYNRYLPNNIPCTSDTVKVYIHWTNIDLDTQFRPITFPTYCHFEGSTDFIFTQPGTYRAMVVSRDEDGFRDTAFTNAFTLAESCHSMSGKLYIESGIYPCALNNAETAKRFGNISLISSTGSVITVTTSDSIGNFNLLTPLGLDSCHLKSNSSNYEISCDSQASNLSTSLDTLLGNIGISCSSNQNLSLQHGVTGIEAPGGIGKAGLRVFRGNMNCLTKLNKIMLILSPKVSYLSVYQGEDPHQIIGDTLVWFGDSLTSFSPTSRILMGCMVQTDTNAEIMSSANFSGIIEYLDLEDQVHSRSIDWSVIIDGPYDPNNKEVSPQGVGPTGRVLPETDFIYTINFQNTGTAPARDVRIIDTIPASLDLSTFNVLESSHDMKTTFYDGNKLKFEFIDINLPDSNENEPASKGWLSFSISAKEGLPLLTQIKNRVGIYFDYNDPIITNYTINTIDTFLQPIEAQLISEPIKCDSGFTIIETEMLSGNPPHIYLWSTGETTPTIRAWNEGTYSVTITDRVDSSVVYQAEITREVSSSQPTIGTISSPTPIQAWTEYVHTVEPEPNAAFEWTVHGGEVISSAGNSVRVLWHAGPEASITVTKINGDHCIAEKTQELPILFVGHDEISRVPVSIYPNPSDGKVTLVSGSKEAFQVELYTIQGKLLSQYNGLIDGSSIDVTGFSKGVYSLRIINGNNAVRVTKLMLN